MIRLALAATIGLAAMGQSVPSEPCGRWPPWTPDYQREMLSFVGPYANSRFGYSVRIPSGETAHADPPPSPSHGFGILLATAPNAYLYVDGSVNALGWSEQVLVATHLDWIREESEQVVSVRSDASKLGPLDARRLVVRRTCKGQSGIFVADETLARSRKHDIVYTVTLLTPESRYAAIASAPRKKRSLGRLKAR